MRFNYFKYRSFPPVSEGFPQAQPRVPNPYPKSINIPNILENLLTRRRKSQLSDSELPFDIFLKAAMSNLELQKQHSYDLKMLCNEGPGKKVTLFGSEFKNVGVLEYFFGRHPRWSRFKKQLTKGVDFFMWKRLMKILDKWM